MLEILIQMPEDDFESIKIKEGIEKLCKNGWIRFGNNGSTLLFKDMLLEDGKKELEYLELDYLEVTEWRE